MTAPALRAGLAGVVLALAGLAGAQADGAQVYQQNCVSCHGAQGGGGVGPALAGNASLQDGQAVLEQIRHGGGGMPAFGEILSDEEIVAVANHIRTGFGNDFGPVEGESGTGTEEGGEAAGTEEGEAAREGDAAEPTADQADADQADGEDRQPAGGAEPEGAATEPAREGGGDDEPAGGPGDGAGDAAEPGGGGGAPTAQVETDEPSPVTTTEETGAAPEGEAADREAPDPDGAKVYRSNCAACHGKQGEGGVGPALAGNATLADGSAVLDQILHGGGGMPAFEGRLSTEEIEAVASYVRTELGNAPAAPATAPPAERGTGGDPGGAAEARAGEAGTGTLRLRVEPPDARLSVTGPPDFQAGPVDVQGGERILSGIPAGGYTVVATLGGRSYRQLVDLDAGETATVTFRLEPEPADDAPAEPETAPDPADADGETSGEGDGP